MQNLVRIAIVAALMTPAAGPARAGVPTFTTIHDFAGGADGFQPQGLVTDGKVLFITTDGSYPSNGTVNRFDPASGQMTLLHSFAPGIRNNPSPEGNLPGPMVMANGLIYGLSLGGPGVGGTVFSVNPATGAFATVYVFNGTNGAYPNSLLVVGNALFVAQSAAGPANSGTLVKIDLTSGVGTVVYNFMNGADGVGPESLIYSGGLIWGATGTGGAQQVGTLFSFDPATNALTTRYTFTRQADGAFPNALLAQGGKIYGFAGGGGLDDAGVSFSFDPVSGIETPLQSMKQGKNKCANFLPPLPYRRVVITAGAQCGPGEYGELLLVNFKTGNPPGVVHRFTDGADGARAEGLVTFGRAYYGVAGAGGAYSSGTIFRLSP